MDTENQVIKLTTNVDVNPTLTAATIIHFTIASILNQTDFHLADFPELVELAAIGTGLGMPRNTIEFVKQVPAHWDSTYWGAYPRPFLDPPTHAYANALAAWSRDQQQPDWIDEMALELRKPTRKSLKFLQKTGDSFYQPASTDFLLKQPQTDWLHMSGNASVSKQIIAMRHFQEDENLSVDQEQVLVQKMRSSNRFVVLNALAAVDHLGISSQAVQDELSNLAEMSDEEIQAKAMITLTRMGPLNDLAIDQAKKMVGSQTKFVSFAGIVGLLSHESVDDDVLKAVDRGFRRALQTCDFEFVELFAMAYCKWRDDAKQYVEGLLVHDQPEYLEIAANAIDEAQQKLVSAE